MSCIGIASAFLFASALIHGALAEVDIAYLAFISIGMGFACGLIALARIMASYGDGETIITLPLI